MDPKLMSRRVGAALSAGARLLAASLVMALVGAFDTDDYALSARTLYWLVGLSGGALAVSIAARLAQGRGPMARALIHLIGGMLVWPWVWTAGVVIFGAPATIARFLALGPGVFFVLAGLLALTRLRRRRPAPPEAPPAVATMPEALARKLPPRLARADLLALEAEDHYVRVHTDRGAAMVLMPFSSALAIAGDGLRTHRSWWVAKAGVEDLVLRKGGGEARLRGGLKVPISRRHLAAVRAVDWR